MTKQPASINGTVTHTFAHRFVIETDKGPVLADLTPHCDDKIKLQIGDVVTLEGEMKPSELKVSRITSRDKTIEIPTKHKKDHQRFVEPEVARRAARVAGYEAIGEPRRKPKHFELLGRRDGCLAELHIELNGTIRKVKSVSDQSEWRERSM